MNISIRSLWLKFRKSAIAADASRVQIEDMERSYYAGFCECFKLLNDSAAVMSKEDGVKVYETISGEVKAWIRKMLVEESRRAGG